MEQQLEFDVKMKTMDMYKFLIYHTYSRFSGWFGVILSIVAIFMLVTGYDTLDDAGKLVLFVIGLLFTVVNPIMLLSKAQQQIVGNAVYKKPLHYVLSEAGITVSQEEQEETMPWEQVRRMKQFRGELFVYTSKIHAFIFPFSQMGEAASEITEYIAAHCSGGSVK